MIREVVEKVLVMVEVIFVTTEIVAVVEIVEIVEVVEVEAVEVVEEVVEVVMMMELVGPKYKVKFHDPSAGTINLV